MSGLTDLQSAVAVMQGAVNAAVSEIQSLASQILTADSDEAVEALAQQINSSAANLQAAVQNATTPPGPNATAPNANSANASSATATGL